MTSQFKKRFFQLLTIASIVAMTSAPVFADSCNQATVPDTDNAALSNEQVDQVQDIIKDYLLKNPEILVTMSQELQKKQQEEQQQTAMNAIIDNKQSLFNAPASPVLGNAKGGFTIVEFYDYQCGHCKTMGDTLHGLLKNNTDIKLILKELPIFGGVSKYAAEASLAVYKLAPKQFQSFHDALLDNNGPLTEAIVNEQAEKVGVSQKQLQKAMKAPAVEKELADNFTLAQKIGINGTPGFVLANSDMSLNEFAFIPGATTATSMQKQLDALGNNSSDN